jgi:hypothetical protein
MKIQPVIAQKDENGALKSKKSLPLHKVAANMVGLLSARKNSHKKNNFSITSGELHKYDLK